MVSIIVPVWNAAKTIRRCVDSIKAQSYSDWEILLSDDGSTDNSLEICKSCARDDARIHVIANCHQGVSSTRNSALDIAKGKFICYVDADDTIDPDYLEVLYAYHDYDMVVCGYWVDIYGQDGVLKSQTKNVQPESAYGFDHKEKMKPLFASGAMHINCNKLLRKDIIDQHHLRYKPYPINEDFIFMMEYLLHCNNLYVVEKATYHWIRVENHLTGVDSLPDNMLQIYNESHILLRRFFEPFSTIADQILYLTYEIVAVRYLKAIDSGRISAERGKRLLHEYHNNELVSASIKAHVPKTLPESFFYHLLSWGFFRTYCFLNKLLAR